MDDTFKTETADLIEGGFAEISVQGLSEIRESLINISRILRKAKGRDREMRHMAAADVLYLYATTEYYAKIRHYKGTGKQSFFEFFVRCCVRIYLTLWNCCHINSWTFTYEFKSKKCC